MEQHTLFHVTLSQQAPNGHRPAPASEGRHCHPVRKHKTDPVIKKMQIFVLTCYICQKRVCVYHVIKKHVNKICMLDG